MASALAPPLPAAGQHVLSQQRYRNSCGAICLLCAALETGHTNYLSIGQAPACALRNDNPSEDALYYISSGLALQTPPATMNGLAVAGYSMPSNLILAARNIGFQNAHIYMRSTLSKALLTVFYAREVTKCRTMAAAPAGGAGPAVSITEGAAAKFSQRPSGRDQGKAQPATGVGEYKLVVVEPYLLSLHYILHRPDGSYMDPSTGRDCGKIPKGYNRTGISIYLS